MLKSENVELAWYWSKKKYCRIEKKPYLCIAFRNGGVTKDGINKGKQAFYKGKTTQK